jgi:hypothetical protein
MTYKRRWLRPSKLREYYIPIQNVGTAAYELYWAVIDSDVRVRRNGRILTKQEAYALSERRWSDDECDTYALPADIELSVEDAERIWSQQSGEQIQETPSLPTKPIRGRGRRLIKRERVMEAMRNDIQQGRVTQDQLRDMLEKNLSDRYKVSRDTARKARQVVLSIIVEN